MQHNTIASKDLSFLSASGFTVYIKSFTWPLATHHLLSIVPFSQQELLFCINLFLTEIGNQTTCTHPEPVAKFPLHWTENYVTFTPQWLSGYPLWHSPPNVNFINQITVIGPTTKKFIPINHQCEETLYKPVQLLDRNHCDLTWPLPFCSLNTRLGILNILL